MKSGKVPVFTATGGDGYPRLNTHPGYLDSGFNDADQIEIVREFVDEHQRTHGLHGGREVVGHVQKLRAGL